MSALEHWFRPQYPLLRIAGCPHLSGLLGCQGPGHVNTLRQFCNREIHRDHQLGDGSSLTTDTQTGKSAARARHCCDGSDQLTAADKSPYGICCANRGIVRDDDPSSLRRLNHDPAPVRWHLNCLAPEPSQTWLNKNMHYHGGFPPLKQL